MTVNGLATFQAVREAGNVDKEGKKYGTGKTLYGPSSP